jgi:hypothetical protein
MFNGVQLTAMYVLDWDRVKIYIEKTADIYAPFVWGGPWATKWQDAAHRTEVVLGDLRVPLVDAQRLDRCE